MAFQPRAYVVAVQANSTPSRPGFAPFSLGANLVSNEPRLQASRFVVISAKAAGMRSSDEEQELIQEAKAASPEAWARIYETYAQKVYLYAFGHTGNQQVAEDITSTVFLKALKAISSYNPSRRPFLAWLYGVARHAVADHFRKWRPAVSLERAPEVLATDPLPAAERLDLRAAVGKLTGSQREVILLYYYAGFSVTEIAAALGKNERAVYSLHARALRTLQRRMSEGEVQGIFRRGRLISPPSSEKLIGRKKIDG